jgi:hypothetical protein
LSERRKASKREKKIEIYLNTPHHKNNEKRKKTPHFNHHLDRMEEKKKEPREEKLV